MGQHVFTQDKTSISLFSLFFHFSYNILKTNEHHRADSRPILAKIILAKVKFPIQFKQVTFLKCSFDWFGTLITILVLKKVQRMIRIVSNGKEWNSFGLY